MDSSGVRGGVFRTRLLHEHDGDIVLDGEYAPAFGAQKATTIWSEMDRLFAYRTGENFQELWVQWHAHFLAYSQERVNERGRAAPMGPRR